MLASGIPLVSVLMAAEEQTDHPRFRAVLADVRATVEGGAPLSEAFEVFPTVFSILCVSTVRAAESTGRLPEALEELADLQDARLRLKRKLRSAMIYPAVVVAFAVLVSLGLIVFVLPVFGQVYAEFGQELPAPTRVLLGISHVLQVHLVSICLGLGLLVGARLLWRRTALGRVLTCWLALHWPIFGDLNRKVVTARFARAYGHLLRSGTPLLRALELAGAATENCIAEQVILNARSRVAQGDTLSEALTSDRIFPDTLRRMIQAGEKSGKIDDMLENVAGYYEDEVRTAVEGLATLLQPLLTILVGLIVGAIVVAMLLPLFRLPAIITM